MAAVYQSYDGEIMVKLDNGTSLSLDNLVKALEDIRALPEEQEGFARYIRHACFTSYRDRRERDRKEMSFSDVLLSGLALWLVMLVLGPFILIYCAIRWYRRYMR